MCSFSEMQNTPPVSIITVCRNSEKTIAKTIESVLHQSYSHLEYLVIDGASTDGTIDIIKQYEPKFNGRMRWLSEKDGGIYDAMNKGVRLAKGTILGIINSDDWYEADAIQRVVNSYRKHGDAVYYGILRVMEDGKEAMLRLVNWQFMYREVVGHPAYFITKNIYNEHGLFRLDYKYAADYEFMMRLVHHKVPFVQINSILANFAQGGKSATHGVASYDEYLRIRHEYGYLTRKAMLLRIVRNKIGSMLEKISTLQRRE